MNVKLYTASQCPHCPLAKAKLKEASIEFVETNTDIDDERLTLYRYGSCTTPTLVVTDDLGVTRVYVGVEEIDTFIEAKAVKKYIFPDLLNGEN